MFDDYGFVVDAEFLRELDKLKKPLLVLLKKQRGKLSPKDYRHLSLAMSDIMSFAFTMAVIRDCSQVKPGTHNVL